MKNLILALIAVVLVASTAHADVTTKAGFLKEVKAALEARDVDALIGLYALEGCPDAFIQDLKNGLPSMVNSLKAIKSVRYARAGPAQPYAKNGAIWVPNAKVLGVIKVTQKSGGTMSMTYGKKGGRFCLPGVTKLRDAATDGAVRLNVFAYGRSVKATLNKKKLSIKGGRSEDIDVTAYAKKGGNTLQLSWKPEKGADPNAGMMGPKITLTHFDAATRKAAWEEVVELKAESGRKTLKFKL